ncbi:MAG: hypothetical protein RI897_1539 [Verrucomicrobiota bacterium]
MTRMTRTIRLQRAACGAAALLLAGRLAAAGMAHYGNEYRMTQPMSGDQVVPALALGQGGGFLVFQDNRTDGSGLGITARRLDGNMIGAFDSFRVNSNGAGDQENPQACLLPDGGAVFVWQGGDGVDQRIFGRVLRPDGTWTGADIAISSSFGGTKRCPSIATLSNGNAVVIWESYDQDGDHFGVFGQIITPEGEKLGSEFQVNQTTQYNQRQASVAALPNGDFIAVWVSEGYSGVLNNTPVSGQSFDTSGGALTFNVQVVSRAFSGDGTPRGEENVCSSADRIAANPSVAVLADGSVLLAWSSFKVPANEQDRLANDRWDVVGVALDDSGAPQGEVFRLNEHVSGDQYAPKVTPLRDHFQVIWTSMGQDGSREGVFGRTCTAVGAEGEELQVNSITASQQLNPAVGSTDGTDALVVWSTFTGLDNSFDVVAQRLSALPSLVAPQPPFVQPLSQSRLVVTWPRLDGMDVAAYEVYVNGESVPVETAETRFYLDKLAPVSTHQVQIAYRLSSGERSPLSLVSEGTTWGEDLNLDFLPDDWQAAHWGAQTSAWAAANADSDGDGATNWQELLAGTNPVDAASVLSTSMETSAQGYHLNWNTQPGSVYQVQVTEDLTTWIPVGAERFAAGNTDSILVQGTSNLVMYRVVRIR